MALTSALFTGLSGLDVNQTRMNVIGNNIANVNTTAFKASRALFKPQFYVTDGGGSAPSTDFGGTNPNQRGLGAEVAAIDKDFTPGSIEPTGKPADLAIDGDGFFVVQGVNQKYTRDGSFSLNSNNELVTSSGDYVQGYGVDTNFNIVPGKLQNITVPLGAASTAEPTKTMQLIGNLDTSGTIATGAGILQTQALTTVGGAAPPTAASALTDVASSTDSATPLFTVGQVFTLAATKGARDMASRTFTVTASSTVADLQTFFQNGLGINTAAPISGTQPTPGLSLVADATDPNSVHLTITSNVGADNAVHMGASSFSDASGASPFDFQDGTDAAGHKSDPTGESIHTSALVYDTLGAPVNVDITAVYAGASNSGTTWQYFVESPDSKATNGSPIVGMGTLSFNTEGKLINTTGSNITIDRTGTGAKTPLSVQVNFDGLTALASRNSSLVMSKQDGSPRGSLTSYSIGTDGVITGSFSNGLTRPLGQVAVATFNNPEGLDDTGGNNYAASANSGAAIISTPLDLGAGSIRSGSLELSNVDLSKEFINLIVASTGFSASSRVISTSDQLLTELLQSAR